VLFVQGNFYLLGDVTVLLRAVAAFELEGCTPEFCTSTGIRFKAMSEILKLRHQLANKGRTVFTFSYQYFIMN